VGRVEGALPPGARRSVARDTKMSRRLGAVQVRRGRLYTLPPTGSSPVRSTYSIGPSAAASRILRAHADNVRPSRAALASILSRSKPLTLILIDVSFPLPFGRRGRPSFFAMPYTYHKKSFLSHKISWPATRVSVGQYIHGSGRRRAGRSAAPTTARRLRPEK
jgi:hypothetical protein